MHVDKIFGVFKQKTAYEVRISDWSSDVCSSDLCGPMDENRLIEQYGLHESLRFQTTDGHIWFDQARMLLMHASTLGEMRRALIEQFGSLKARGIVWRLGIRGGQIDDREAAKRATKADDFDSVRLGTAIHAMQGMVKSDTVSLSLDWERDTLKNVIQCN